MTDHICDDDVTTENAAKKDTKLTLALAIAQGKPVRSWAAANKVPERTAYRWATLPETRKLVAQVRRDFLEAAVGKLATCATRAADMIACLAETAASDSVKLSACRAILTDMMSVSEFSGLEHRMTEIEEKLREQTGDEGQEG